MKLYVGNLPFSATEDTLRELFSAYGHVISARLVTDRFSRKSKGFGFVEMSSNSEAMEAIAALAGYMLEGRPLTVAPAHESSQDGGNDSKENSRSSTGSSFTRDDNSSSSGSPASTAAAAISETNGAGKSHRRIPELFVGIGERVAAAREGKIGEI